MNGNFPSADALCGLDSLLFDYAALAEGDFVLIAYRRECAVAVSWMVAALSVAHIETRLLCIESANETDFAASVFPALDMIETHNRQVHLFIGENESLSFTATLRVLRSRPDLSIWRLMNLTPALFELGVRVSPETLKAINAGLLHRLMKKQTIQIFSAGGAVLDVEIDPGMYQWISNHGRSNPGELIALPAGEVNTFPVSINGDFVADGAMHANIRLPFDVRLHDRPIALRIEDGGVKSFECGDPDLARGLEAVFSNELCRRVGEIGFGTNVGVTAFTRENSHINERYPAVHVGLGEHTQPGRVDYEAPIHIDLIARHSRVRTFDGEPEIDMSALSTSTVRHPHGTRGEDLEHVPA